MHLDKIYDVPNHFGPTSLSAIFNRLSLNMRGGALWLHFSIARLTKNDLDYKSMEIGQWLHELETVQGWWKFDVSKWSNDEVTNAREDLHWRVVYGDKLF